jgi:hypothetical protein
MLLSVKCPKCRAKWESPSSAEIGFPRHVDICGVCGHSFEWIEKGNSVKSSPKDNPSRASQGHSRPWWQFWAK